MHDDRGVDLFFVNLISSRINTVALALNNNQYRMWIQIIIQLMPLWDKSDNPN